MADREDESYTLIALDDDICVYGKLEDPLMV
jgi:hypothetical protein